MLRHAGRRGRGEFLFHDRFAGELGEQVRDLGLSGVEFIGVLQCVGCPLLVAEHEIQLAEARIRPRGVWFRRNRDLVVPQRVVVVAALTVFLAELDVMIRRRAAAAGIELGELRAIEQDDTEARSIRVIFKLAQSLDLSPEKLAVLAGLAETRNDPALSEATVRFAAKSSTAQLSKEQRRVLDEYVKVLSASPKGP